ncbi:MAG: DUF3800 domain-containing protein [Aliarcobacter sp.]|jgi:hypothetical protein|nr:DUF3800 domain-containing protein [Aliarcobacter sp.]
MHIAIDDTYGPTVGQNSRFVTGDRRTHVAVLFQDSEVEYIRKQIKDCLLGISQSTGKDIKEFHFVDIYNRREPWNDLAEGFNLDIIEFFADIYKTYKWKVEIQTVDNHTFREHNIKIVSGKIDGLDLSKKEGQSLILLLLKIQDKLKLDSSPLKIYMDEGNRKPGASFATDIFSDWSSKYEGIYASSEDEPLLQIADFLAFSINRVIHLSLKKNRSDIDLWFIDLIGRMGINCSDISQTKVDEDFNVTDIDSIHERERAKKGLKNK